MRVDWLEWWDLRVGERGGLRWVLDWGEGVCDGEGDEEEEVDKGVVFFIVILGELGWDIGCMWGCGRGWGFGWGVMVVVGWVCWDIVFR